MLVFSSTALADAYSEDWTSWENEAEIVSKCQDDKRLAAFLERAAADLPNAHRSEGNLEVIDNIILSNPSCFLRALALVPRAQCVDIIYHFVGASDMHDQSLIDSALLSVSPKAKNCYAS